MPGAIINVYSHHFSVIPISVHFEKLVKKFSFNFLYSQVFRNSRGDVVSDNSKMFAAATKDRKLYRFHYNCYYSFLDFLKDNYIKEDDYDVVIMPVPTYKKAKFVINKPYEPKEYQIPVIEYIVNPETPKFKLLALNTGEGKTISSFFAMKELGMRTVVILRPGYISRWIDEVIKVFDISKVNILEVIGGSHLKGFISGSRDNTLNWDLALISNKTYQNYIKSYEDLKEDMASVGYDCAPHEFFETVGAGLRIIDETHQDFHFNFKLDLYSNVSHSLSLSATLVSRDGFMERMYEIAYPKSLRYHTVEVKRFVKSTAVFYSINNKYTITHTRRGTSSYSHIVYEDSIQKYPKVLRDYLNMISYYVRHGFMDKRDKEDKMVIFAASVSMCSVIAKHLQKEFPNLSVEKYTAEDNYSNLIDPNIRVTTIQSGGTAHDIPNLTTILMAVSIDSIQSSLQSFGRIRNIKDKELRYIYLVDEGNSKHMKYHKGRKVMLGGRTLTLNELWYSKTLGA